LAYLGQHVGSAAFALASLAYVLPRVPFYPEAAIIPLIIVPAFLALLWPFGGGVLALVLMAPPVFAYGAGWGVLYLIPAVLTMGLLRWKHREWAALLPGAVPLAVAWYIGLCLMPLAGAVLRRWGALAGVLSGTVLAVTGGLAGWVSLPYTFTPSPGATLTAAEHAASPIAVLEEIGRLFALRPELVLQIVLFTVLSLPIYLWIGRSAGARMWGVSLYLMIVLLGFVLGPILLFDAPVHLGPFLASYAPCAIITTLLGLSIPSVRGGSL
jgi:hypothetical protein